MGDPCLEFWNNLCHIDLMEEWVYYNYWLWSWALGPVFGLLIFLYDCLSGFFFPCVPPCLVTRDTTPLYTHIYIRT